MDRSSKLELDMTCLRARASPLYISTFIRKMMCISRYRIAHGVFQQLEALIQYLLQPKDAASLHDFVLRRLEFAFILPRLMEPYRFGHMREGGVRELGIQTGILQVANDAGSVTMRTVKLIDCQQCLKRRTMSVHGSTSNRGALYIFLEKLEHLLWFDCAASMSWR